MPARRLGRVGVATLLLASVSGCGVLANSPCDSENCVDEMAAVASRVEQDERVLEVREAVYLPVGPGIGQSLVRVSIEIEPAAVDERDALQQVVVDAVEDQQIEDLEGVVLKVFVDGEQLELGRAARTCRPRCNGGLG